MAEKGATLQEVYSTCAQLSASCGSVGVASSGATLPGAKTPMFTVTSGTLELGLGVHGEAGARTIKVLYINFYDFETWFDFLFYSAFVIIKAVS